LETNPANTKKSDTVAAEKTFIDLMIPLLRYSLYGTTIFD